MIDKLLKDKRINNTWNVIKISELPEDYPCLAVSVYPAKSMAQFHLVEYCLIPAGLNKKHKKKAEPQTLKP